MTNTQEFLMKKIKEREGNYFNIIENLLDIGIEQEKAVNIYNVYKKHKNFLNNNNVYFFDYLDVEKENLKKQFENFSDDIHKTIVKSNHKKIKKILHSNHNNIINEETDNIIQLFAESNISPKIIKQFVGKKIRAFKNSDDLNEELQKLYEEIDGSWNLENYLEKVKNSNSKIVLNKDNKIAIEILNFEDAQKLGTKNWCISREELFYKDYTENYQRFVFILDFEKAPFLEDSMKAVIVELDGNIEEVYNKSDIRIDNNSVLIEKEAFNKIDKEILISKINHNHKNIDSPRLSMKTIAQEYIIYGLHEEAKELLGDKYEENLNYLFSNKLSKIINGKNTIPFLKEFDKNTLNLEIVNSYDVFEWIREVSYLDKDTIKDFFEIPIIKKLFNNELETIDQEIKEYELSESITHFFSSNNKNNFDLGLSFIKHLEELGADKAQDLIKFKNISYEALEFLENKNLFQQENGKNIEIDLSILKSNQNEDFFNKYFEIIDLKSQGDNYYNQISQTLYLNVFQNMLQNKNNQLNGVHYGLKSYLKDDFDNVQEKYFKIDEEKMKVFSVIVMPKDVKESFTKLSSLFKIDKISPEITQDILIKSLCHINSNEYKELSEEEKVELLQEQFKDLPIPLKNDFIKFIKNEEFDLSQSKDLLNKLSSIEGFEEFKLKRKNGLKI